MAKVGLSAPWVEFYDEVEALFKEDKEIKTVYDEDNKIIKVYVSNATKAEALTQLLPAERIFGKVTVQVQVIPANTLDFVPRNLFAVAFEGNPALSFVQDVTGVFENPISYVVFKNKVVQYWNDNLGDIYGNRSTLYQEIAKDVFGDQQGVFFCTDKADDD